MRPEIYRIVSVKQLEGGAGEAPPGGRPVPIVIAPTQVLPVISNLPRVFGLSRTVASLVSIFFTLCTLVLTPTGGGTEEGMLLAALICVALSSALNFDHTMKVAFSVLRC